MSHKQQLRNEKWKYGRKRAIIAYLQFRVLDSKTSLLFAGQNDLFYDRYRFYDSFVASITLQSSSGLSFEFETTVSFLRPELFYFCLPSVLRIVLSSLPHTLLE